MKEKSTLDEVAEMTAEEFERLSDEKKLEWFKEFVEELGKHGVLAVPSLEVRAKWEALTTSEENHLSIDDAAVRITEPQVTGASRLPVRFRQTPAVRSK